MATYFPSTDAGMLNWAQGFSGFINAFPADYGLTAEEADAYAVTVAAYATAYGVATNAGARTTPAIQAKNTAKKNLVAATRPLVNQIQIFPGTTDSMRRDLRITVRDTENTPIPVPDTTPVLTVVAVMGRKIKINLRTREADGKPSENRARPVGVKGATVYYAAGEDYPQDLEAWKFLGNQAKTTIDLTIPYTVPGGTKVWLAAQWTNTKLQTGPACPPVETRIAGGLSQAA